MLITTNIDIREFWFSILYNQLLFAAISFRDSSMINWLAASNFRARAIFIRNCIKHLVRDEKYAPRWGSRKPGEIFSLANKN
jgi:hypothetical protein